MPRIERRYDKGEKRLKHEGRSLQPEIQLDNGRYVGKCPSPAGMRPELREKLLNEAIPGPNGDRDIEYSKCLYVVHEGAIYEAQTSDGGTSYHGYPYRGKLNKKLLKKLREMAEGKKCLRAFDDWVKRHIQSEGPK